MSDAFALVPAPPRGEIVTDDQPGSGGPAPGRDREIDSQLAILRDRFGARLTPGEWNGVRKAIAEQREHAAKLRAVPLLNADEPATIFSVDADHG